MKNKCLIGYKTLLEKEKLLVTSNFSFSHNVFHSYISFVRQNAVFSGTGLMYIRDVLYQAPHTYGSMYI